MPTIVDLDYGTVSRVNPIGLVQAAPLFPAPLQIPYRDGLGKVFAAAPLTFSNTVNGGPPLYSLQNPGFDPAYQGMSFPTVQAASFGAEFIPTSYDLAGYY